MSTRRRTVRISVGLLLAASVARAADVRWISSGEASWHEGTNWHTGSPPADVDRAVITNYGKPVVTGDTAITNLWLSNGAFRVESGILAITTGGAIYAPESSSGTVEVAGGGITNNGEAYWGYAPAGDMLPGPERGFLTMRLTGGRVVSRGNMRFGHGSGGFDVDMSGDADLYCGGSTYIGGGDAASSHYARPGRPRTFRVRGTAKVRGNVMSTQCSIGFDTTFYLEEGALASNYVFAVGPYGANYPVTNAVAFQTGGTNYIQSQGNIGPSPGTNRYVLSGGLVHAPAIVEVCAFRSGVTTTGTALFVQSGGLARISQLRLCRTPYTDAATGLYHLVGGVLDNLNNVIEISTRTTQVGLHGAGILRLGDAATSGVVTNCATMTLIRTGITNETARAVVEGWGDLYVATLRIPDTATTGRYEVVADGYGNPRTLRFARPGMAIVNGMENTAANGWYARNGGRLELPPLPVKTGAFITNWGESGDDAQIDLVNSMRLVFNSVSATGNVAVALLATNRGEVAFGPQDRVIGVWEIARSGGLTYSTVDLTVRYDHVAAANLGLGDGDLNLYRWTGSAWQSLNASLDSSAKTLSAAGVNPGADSSFLVSAGKILAAGPRGTMILIR